MKHFRRWKKEAGAPCLEFHKKQLAMAGALAAEKTFDDALDVMETMIFQKH